MATGYTDVVAKGEMTDFSEFALRCTRAMGVAISQRDESLDVPTRHHEVVDAWYAKRVEEARAAFEEASSWSLADWAREEQRSREEENASRSSYRERSAREVANEQRMLALVQAWAPPTADHQGLKDFMIEQLESSIRFDKPGSWAAEDIEPRPVREYADTVLAQRLRALQVRRDELRKQEERIASRNRWIDDLLASLPNQAVFDRISAKADPR